MDQVDEVATLFARLSPAEERFEAWRKRVGGVLGPVVFVALLAAPLPGLSGEAHRLAAVMGGVVVLWVTEALPMPVTALLAAAACIVLRVAPAKDVLGPFADQLMFLFIGSFMLARAIFLHGLDRRLAFGVMSLRCIGTHPGRVLFAFGATTALISAWISNTATTAMMFAIALSIVRFLEQRPEFAAERPRAALGRYATGLMLMTSFSASIGGLATPIGTPPNVIGLGFIRRQLGVDITFLQWAQIGVPVVVVLFLVLFSYLYLLCARGMPPLAGSDQLLARERDKLGAWTAGQRGTVAAFVVMVSLWVFPGLVALMFGQASATYTAVREMLPEAVAALLGAGLLFVLPGNREGRVLTWNDAVAIDWGVVLLYGGGFALGVLSDKTGLATAVGQGLTGWLPISGSVGLLLAATVVATLVSEATSNTAAANIVIPVVIALAVGAGLDPVAAALAATFASSLGFMLPVSTPCNAIVYGSGLVPLSRMIRYGLLLDVAGVLTVFLLLWLGQGWLVPGR